LELCTRPYQVGYTCLSHAVASEQQGVAITVAGMLDISQMGRGFFYM
jgi:hypothetical protein